MGYNMLRKLPGDYLNKSKTQHNSMKVKIHN
jgi:hypothetical protein